MAAATGATMAAARGAAMAEAATAPAAPAVEMAERGAGAEAQDEARHTISPEFAVSDTFSARPSVISQARDAASRNALLGP